MIILKNPDKNIAPERCNAVSDVIPLSNSKSGIFIMKEIWKTVKGFEDYEVSNLGKVRSKDRYRNYPNGKRFHKGKILKYSINPVGYRRVHITKNKKPYHRSVARLVAIAFIPNKIPERIFVNHKNGDKSDNSVSNLEWCTQSENEKHAYKNKLKIPLKGEKHHRNKYKEELIRAIRKEYKLNPSLTHSSLAKKYNIKRRYITEILNYDVWKHI